MTMRSRVKTAAVAVLAPVLLGGCLYDGLYSGVSVGAGNYGYGDPYGYPYGYDPYGGYYGGRGYGWYDGYYYPGSGAYVYDRAGRGYRMRAQDRAYWEARREARAERREQRMERREDRLERRLERREMRAERRNDPALIERRQARRSEGVFNERARQAVRRAVRNNRDPAGTTTDEP
jgi:hypothetical protein